MARALRSVKPKGYLCVSRGFVSSSSSCLVPSGPVAVQARCQRTPALTREWLLLPGRGSSGCSRAPRPPSFMACWLAAQLLARSPSSFSL